MPKDFGGKKNFSGGKPSGGRNLSSKPVDLKKKPFEKKQHDSKPRTFAKPENKKFNAKKSSDDSEEKKRKRDDDTEAMDTSAPEEAKYAYDENGNRRHLTKKEKRKLAKPQDFDKLYKHNIKELTKEQQVKLMGDELALIQGKIQTVIFEEIYKREAMKTIQLIIKYGSEEHRNTVFDELKGSIYKLAVHVNGYYLVKNMLKYMKDKRDNILKELSGHYKELLSHKDASVIMNYIWEEISNGTQKSQMLLEFYSQEFVLFKTQEKITLDDILTKQPAKKDVIMRNLKENVSHLADKGVPVISYSMVHHLYYQFVSHADKSLVTEFLSSLREQIPYILHTWDGARVAAAAIAYGNAKDRKIMIKSLKGYVTKACNEEYGQLVILRILDLLDDTTLVNKLVLSAMVKDIKELMESPVGYLPFLFILAGKSSKYFRPPVMKELNGDCNPDSSKKDPEVRRKELLSYVLKPLTAYITSEIQTLLKVKNGCDLIYETIKALDESARQLALKFIVDLVKADNDTWLSEQWTHRLLKKLVVEIEGFAPMLYAVLEKKADLAVKKHPSFVILSLLEHASTGAQMKAELKTQMAKLKTSTEAGSKLIVDNLNGVKTGNKPNNKQK